jgi:rSAM/selenodomain-associated transferase 1
MKIQLFIMCKAPVAGRVKTRLFSYKVNGEAREGALGYKVNGEAREGALGYKVNGEAREGALGYYSPEQAARLYASMAETVIHRASRLFDHVCIAADDPVHPFFSTFDLPLCAQGDGDLGQRMSRLMLQGFADGADAVMFLGTDSPHMPDSRLLQAAEALQNHDIVIGPVEDGGYDLIAMTVPEDVFNNITWSSGQVLEQTLSHIQRLGLSCLQLDVGFDIDYPEDVERAAQAGWQPRSS